MAIFRSAGLALAISLSSAAVAQTPSAQMPPAQTPQTWTLNRAAPIAVYAEDEGLRDTQTCRVALKGNAEVTQDRLRLRAQAMTLHLARDANGCTDAPERLEAEKDVYYVTPLEAVRAASAVYDIPRDTVTFTGDVILTRGQNVSTSQTLVINLKTNAVTWKGGVQAVFYPAPSASLP